MPFSLHSAFSWKTESHLAPAFKSDEEPFQSILTLFSDPFVRYNRLRPVLRPLISVQMFLYALLPAGFTKLRSTKGAVLSRELFYDISDVLPVTDDTCSSLVTCCTDLHQCLENVASLFLNCVTAGFVRLLIHIHRDR